ncbi:virulence factor MVIN family protein [Rivularia sp. IAM M-261]|nr:virulence factor MVIN family protein [Calothrix sp. PCC 7716]GJD17377.1 virulence factor MVIN family protein [Rivularia sp. IAM M-261]
MYLTKILSLWNRLTTGSTNRKILGAAITVGLGVGFSKGIAVLKELVVAWKFGTNDELDAYFIAIMVPFFIINVIAGALNEALVPTYIQVLEKEGRKSAQSLLSGAMVLALSLLVITAILIVVTTPIYVPFITKGFNIEKTELTFHLIYAVSPFVLISGCITIFSAILNAKERFALSAFTPTLTPVATIIFLLSLESWKSFSLVAGLLSGTTLEIVILGLELKRQGISMLPKWHGFSKNLRQVVAQYLPSVTAAFLMCSTGIVDQSMAAMLAPGSVAALNYADKVVVLPIFLTTTALNTAVIPYFSKMVAHHDWQGVLHTLKHYLRLIFIVTLPFTVLLVFASETIVKLLLQRGSFTPEDTQLVSQIQNCYALQIPFYVGAVFLVQLIISIKKNRILMWGSALNLIVNVIGNYTLMHFFGIQGIALSTSIVYLISFNFLLFFSFKYLKEITNNNKSEVNL